MFLRQNCLVYSLKSFFFFPESYSSKGPLKTWGTYNLLSVLKGIKVQLRSFAQLFFQPKNQFLTGLNVWSSSVLEVYWFIRAPSIKLQKGLCSFRGWKGHLESLIPSREQIYCDDSWFFEYKVFYVISFSGEHGKLDVTTGNEATGSGWMASYEGTSQNWKMGCKL